MVTAWQVYWAMQLDSILIVTGYLSFICTFFGGIGYLGHRVARVYSEDDPDLKSVVASTWIAKPMFLIGILAIAANAFLPSSKTVAAMIVLPAITSETVIDNVTPEAKELYGLAKDALKNLGAKDKPVEPKKAK